MCRTLFQAQIIRALHPVNLSLESNAPFDVAPYLDRRIKTPVEKIQAAMDGEMCAEQAEKLRIIRSHMSSLELCKANLESQEERAIQSGTFSPL